MNEPGQEISLVTPPPGITQADYAAIEEAVMETARGRWFLLEYARRQRAAETQRLADAIDRLETIIAQGPAAPRMEALVEPTNETAAAVAERLSDIVWSMRERGVGDQFCAELEKQIGIIRTLRAEISSGFDETAIENKPQLALAAPDEMDDETDDEIEEPEADDASARLEPEYRAEPPAMQAEAHEIAPEAAPQAVAPVKVAPVEAAPVEAAPVKAAPVEIEPFDFAPVEAEPVAVAPAAVAPAAVAPAAVAPRPPAVAPAPVRRFVEDRRDEPEIDPRLVALAHLDAMRPVEKLALFC